MTTPTTTKEALSAAQELADVHDIQSEDDVSDIARRFDAFAAEAVKAEREACAEMIDLPQGTEASSRRRLAAMLRARGNTNG